MMTETTCVFCQAPFEYENKGRKRMICPKCQLANAKASKRRWDRSIRTAQRTGETAPRASSQARFADLATREGISEGGAELLVRRALTKIARHPELKALWQAWREEGMPIPGAQTEPGEQLLEWEIELSDWYLLYERLIKARLPEEAAECLAEIEKAAGALRLGVQKVTQ